MVADPHSPCHCERLIRPIDGGAVWTQPSFVHSSNDLPAHNGRARKRLKPHAQAFDYCLERELAAVQADTRLLEEGYGPANLQLEIIKTYIGKTLLENAAVVRWLAKTHSEYLQQLQFIAEIKQLPSQ